MVNERTHKQEILDALGKFNEESKLSNDKIVNDLKSKWKTPEVIYHYTNDFGVRGILETGKCWLTDIFKLNDPSELEHGISHLIEALEAASDSGGQTLAAHVKAFREKGLDKSAYYFVCSFSSDGDELGQWRAYADNGRGFALGFDRKILEDAFMNDKTANQNNATFPVTYDEAYLSRIQRELVEELFLKIHWHSFNYLGNGAYFNNLLFPLIEHSLYRTLHFKHNAYKNEQEYRFLQIFPSNQLPPERRLRSRDYSLVGYREFDWRSVAAKALREIKIGPGADKEKAMKFVQDCLQGTGIGQIEPTVSKIPYRAL